MVVITLPNNNGAPYERLGPNPVVTCSRRKEITARFDGGDITSDCRALLLAQANQKSDQVDAMADDIIDERQIAKVQPPLQTLLRHRRYISYDHLRKSNRGWRAPRLVPYPDKIL